MLMIHALVFIKSTFGRPVDRRFNLLYLIERQNQIVDLCLNVLLSRFDILKTNL
jgi:hypothetical protein